MTFIILAITALPLGYRVHFNSRVKIASCQHSRASHLFSLQIYAPDLVIFIEELHTVQVLHALDHVAQLLQGLGIQIQSIMREKTNLIRNLHYDTKLLIYLCLLDLTV